MEKLKGEYKETSVFFKNLKWYILIASLIFLAVAIGSHFAISALIAKNPETADNIFAQIESLFTESKDIMTESGDINPIKLFFNNVTASVFSAMLGFIPFLFIPITSLFTNAALMGAITALLQASDVNVFLYFTAAVAPHGIFEIPALIISLALGFMLCKEITAKLFRRGKFTLFELIGESARVIILIVVPLLAIAAVIESYITPLFIIFLK